MSYVVVKVQSPVLIRAKNDKVLRHYAVGTILEVEEKEYHRISSWVELQEAEKPEAKKVDKEKKNDENKMYDVPYKKGKGK